MKIKSAILRSYVALARGEHFTESEIGETISDAPAIQRNWVEDENLSQLVCAAWNLTQEEFDAKMIFPKPSATVNIVYSSILLRVYGKSFLELAYNGIFILPLGYGFIVPKKEGYLITELKLYSYSELNKKAKVF